MAVSSSISSYFVHNSDGVGIDVWSKVPAIGDVSRASSNANSVEDVSQAKRLKLGTTILRLAQALLRKSSSACCASSKDRPHRRLPREAASHFNCTMNGKILSETPFERVYPAGIVRRRHVAQGGALCETSDFRHAARLRDGSHLLGSRLLAGSAAARRRKRAYVSQLRRRRHGGPPM
jgi:hypothetical protein